MDLDTVIDHLYSLGPSEFTGRRDALAAEARRSGDRDLATGIKSLKKPSAAASTVNLMARVRAGEIDRLIALGGRLREAQEALSGEQLRALGRQRQHLIAGLAQEARRAARQAGHPISDAVQREVESTFEAALADEAAGEAVRQGRLVRSLERSGLDPVDLAGAVAGGRAASGLGSPGTGTSLSPSTGGERAGDELARARRAREEAEREEKARELEQALEAAARADAEARQSEDRRAVAVSEHQRAERRRDQADEAVDRLQEQLAAARVEAERATAVEQAARRARREAENEAEEAATAAERARRRADTLGS